MRNLILVQTLILAITAAPLLATTAKADDWQPLDAVSIKTALAARKVTYKDGATQQFNADGSTTYTANRPSKGRWRIDGPQYCSQWPPSDQWSCYDVAISGAGLDLRFTAADGSESVGRYVDLK